ncbi:YajQ family cyclic di-GMP-binding protein [Candidatus Marinamargulisbacteria bacterium SCGC AG-343-D04]|nr:YajQ family cyclic di-GMP-binding protein [Candidatus Marinamargulisbacteria bacterium SCGC AG-343-D04]
MADKFSFDITGKIELQEIDNAINQALKEISHRYDIKDSQYSITFSKESHDVSIEAEDDFKCRAIKEILNQKFVLRGVSLSAIDYGKIDVTLSKAKLTGKIQSGLPQDKAKVINKAIKDTKIKVNAQIMNDVIRVASKSKNDLQAVMKELKSQKFDCYFGFSNFR